MWGPGGCQEQAVGAKMDQKAGATPQRCSSHVSFALPLLNVCSRGVEVGQMWTGASYN